MQIAPCISSGRWGARRGGS